MFLIMDKDSYSMREKRLGEVGACAGHVLHSSPDGIPIDEPDDKEYFGISDYLKQKYQLSSWIEKI